MSGRFLLVLLATGLYLAGADEEECKQETTLVLLKPDAVIPENPMGPHLHLSVSFNGRGAFCNVPGQNPQARLIPMSYLSLQVSRGYVGAAISMFEAKGMEIVGIKYHEQASETLLIEHYQEHAGKKFFPELLSTMSAGPIIALKVKGAKAVARVRNMLGSTDPGNPSRVLEPQHCAGSIAPL
jgi:nucleoside diphosphate kinase